MAINTTVVTVKTGKTLTVNKNGFTFTYVAGETVAIPTFEVTYLRNAGIIV